MQVKDVLTGEVFPVHAKKIINATGPWVDTVREMDQSKKGKYLQLTKGVHVVIDQSRFPLKQAVYFDTPDGRMVFAIPREGKAYVGTTDTVYGADPKKPRISVKDRDYIIAAINYMFPSLNITADDIESGWAGVRPLISQEGKGASEISRKDETWVSDSGLITIAGGKLTGYRKMAENVVDLVAKQFSQEGYKVFGGCATEKMPISGGHVDGSKAFADYIKQQKANAAGTGLSGQEAEQLVSRYGSNAPILFDIARESAEEAEKAGLPLVLLTKLKYAIQHEMVYTPVDFLNRRTSMILFDIHSTEKWKKQIIDYMAEALSWTEKQKEDYTKELEEELYFAVNAQADAD